MEIARNFDMESIPLVRWIFWLRGKLLGATPSAPARHKGIVREMSAIGWGVLADEPGGIFIAGAFCQPWRANVVFRPIPPERFAGFAEPDQVKIVWTLEAESLGPDVTRLATETRVKATDASARAKFYRYWLVFGLGVLVIRRLLLRAVRVQAEKTWRITHSLSPGRTA